MSVRLHHRTWFFTLFFHGTEKPKWSLWCTVHHTIHTISVVMSWVVGQHQFQKQGSKAWYSVAHIMILGHQMINFGLKKPTTEKDHWNHFGIIQLFYMEIISHFQVRSSSAFWAFLSRRVKACVRAKYTPSVALAWHFSPKIVYSHINFSSKQLLHWGRKLAYGSLTVYSQLFFGQQLFFSQDPRWKS